MPKVKKQHDPRAVFIIQSLIVRGMQQKIVEDEALPMEPQMELSVNAQVTILWHLMENKINNSVRICILICATCTLGVMKWLTLHSQPPNARLHGRALS